jgi:hypothetical protein
VKKAGMKCTVCGKIAKKSKLRFQGYDINGWKCSCGEEYYNPDEAQKILLLNKILKKRFEVKIGKIRSNLIIRIPTELAEALGLKKGGKVILKADNSGRFYVDL